MNKREFLESLEEDKKLGDLGHTERILYEEIVVAIDLLVLRMLRIAPPEIRDSIRDRLTDEYRFWRV